MVDRPSINPQRVAGGAQEVPTLRNIDVPNITGTGMVRPSGFERAAQAFGVQASIAEDQSRRYGIMRDEILQQIRDKQKVEADRVASEAAIEAQQAAQAASLNSDSSTLMKNTMDAFNEVSTSTVSREGLTEYQRKYLGEKMQDMSFTLQSRTIDAQLQMAQAEFENDLFKRSEADTVLISQNPSLINTVMESLRADIMSNGSLSLVQKEAFIQQKEAEYVDAAIRGAIATSGGQVAENFIKSGALDFGLTGKLKTQYLDMADAAKEKAKQEFTIEQLRALGELEARIDLEPAGVTDTDIATAKQTYGLSNSQVAGMFERRTKAAAKNKEDNAAMDAVATMLASGTPLSPTNKEHQKGADAYFQKYIVPEVSNLLQSDPDAAAGRVADFIVQTGLTPDTARDYLSGSLMNGTREQQMLAADIIARVDNSRKPVDFDLPAGIRERASLIRKMQNISKDTDELFDKVNRQVDMSETSVKSREAFVREEFDDKLAMKQVTTTFQNMFGFDPAMKFGVNERERIMDDVYSYVENAYKRNPDLDLETLYKAAAAELKPRYGVTNADGLGKRVVPYPIEKYVPYTSSQINDYVKEQLADTPFAGEDFIITSDDLTARAVNDKDIPARWKIYTTDGTMYSDTGLILTQDEMALSFGSKVKRAKQSLVSEAEAKSTARGAAAGREAMQAQKETGRALIEGIKNAITD